MKIILYITFSLSISLNAQEYNDEITTVQATYVDESVEHPFSEQTKSNSCSNTPEGTLELTECADVGTAAFSTGSVATTMVGVNAASDPATMPCADNGQTYGNWYIYDLDPGVEQVQFGWGGNWTGSDDVYLNFYQGTDCANLTYDACGTIVSFGGVSGTIESLTATGLDDTQPLWVYAVSNKAFSFDLILTGVGPEPVNADCASASTSTVGCNLGASGATFTPPGNTCTGGNWGSNENTVFYTFTASETSGSIDIDNMLCNDGTGGNAQVGVWTDCAAVGTYAGNYYGCAVGTGTILLPTLVIGDSYIIAVDGFAGDACVWDFVTTGIILTVELSQLNGYAHERGYNAIEWITSSENNNDYFTIENSADGSNWEKIATINGQGNSNEFNNYHHHDYNRQSDVNYYKLSQTDYNGKSTEIDILRIDNSDIVKHVLKITNIMGQEVDVDYKGLRIIIYTDGTTEKVYINSL